MNRFIGLILSAVIPCIGITAQMLPVAKGEFEIDGRAHGNMFTGKESQWVFRYFDIESGKQFKMFMEMHAKPMHMITVSSDLSNFAHIHPYLDKKTGDFNVSVNSIYDDPDNFMTQNAVVDPGRYFIFTEVMPMGTFMMAMNRFEFNAYKIETESSQSVPKKLIPDLKIGDEFAVKYFNEKGEVGVKGDLFKVVLEIELFSWCDFYKPKFYFTIYKRSTDKTYQPIEDFEKWLGMGGHAVLVSEAGDKLEEKVFHHLHAFKPISTVGEFTFPYDDHKKRLPDGVYKVWGQFKHKGQILTIPFVFEYENPEMDFNDEFNLYSTKLNCR